MGWGGSTATAAGVAAGAGAAQLGFGYGLGILNWAPADTTASTATWVASLIWATWIAATSTIVGAVCAQRLHDRRFAAPSGSSVPGTDAPPANADRRGDGLWWTALSGAAALGALITVLLVAVPARVAVVPDTASPRDMAASYAALGVLIGALVALWALRCRAAAANVVATAGWLWLLAVVAVVDSVLAGRGLTTAQLGIWQLSSDSDQFWVRDYFYWPGAVLSLGSALLIGVLAARRGVREADRRVGATASGAAGPLLVAVAYLLAVPRLTAISPEQVSAHLIAPYAAIVGVGGSVLVAALAQRTARRATDRPVDAVPTAAVPRQRTGTTADTGPATVPVPAAPPRTDTAPHATDTTPQDPDTSTSTGPDTSTDATGQGTSTTHQDTGTTQQEDAGAESASRGTGRRARTPRRPR
ncbi:hypothetical protein D3H59_09285 [Micromonospora endophytica]|nr:hypothetical protein D3H59_09285 [Micromonospora endophytica]